MSIAETQTPGANPRQRAMGLLARAQPEVLAELFPDLPKHNILRGPEIGAVMVRGRMGGSGAPFNMGEMSVTRCSVSLPCGTVGHAYVQGRDKSHARRAAVLDALLETGQDDTLSARILTPLETAETEHRESRARKAAATKVEFFTMVRGED